MYAPVQRKKGLPSSPQRPASQRVPAVQTQLTVNTPGDRYEREADAMADQIMRMPARGSLATPSLTPLAGSIQRKCAACEEEDKVQRKESTASTPIVTPSLSAQLSSTKGRGGALPGTTQSLMNQAFGTDFSGVRVHTDGAAASMSQQLNARAFTHGSDIYFNRGEFAPEAPEGKRLLGHELTHVVQQVPEKIQRSINFLNPIPVENDPLPLVLRNDPLGRTTASFNQNVLPNGRQQAGQTVLNALNPTSLAIQRGSDGLTFTARIDAPRYNVNVSAAMETITEPEGGTWVGTCPPLPFPDRDNCRVGGRTRVEMSGFPNLHATVNGHENEHWIDIQRLTNEELRPVHDFMLQQIGTGATELAAMENWATRLGTRDIDAVDIFLTRLLAANARFDTPGTGPHFTRTRIGVNPDCTNITITPR